jgi:hypothetical protein
MSYFVTLPIGERSLGAEIRGYGRPVDALAFGEQLATRYPLVLVAEDFGEGIRMGLLTALGREVTKGWRPDQWTANILSSYGGCWKRALEMRVRSKALSIEVEKSLQFIGPQPKPKGFYLYAVDADQNVIEKENASCDTRAEVEKLLADRVHRFPGVVVVDANHGSEEGPYPLYVVGDVEPELVYELFTFGRSMSNDSAEAICVNI